MIIPQTDKSKQSLKNMTNFSLSSIDVSEDWKSLKRHDALFVIQLKAIKNQTRTDKRQNNKTTEELKICARYQTLGISELLKALKSKNMDFFFAL